MSNNTLKLIRDSAPNQDAFGPHSRIASILANQIRSFDTSASAGIEGEWGTGKSSVIHFVKEELAADIKAGTISFFIFDAWAHEGDELRRSFLDELNECINTSKEQKEKLRSKIWRSEEIVNISATKRLTTKAILLALAIAAVPPSSALLDLTSVQSDILLPRILRLLLWLPLIIISIVLLHSVLDFLRRKYWLKETSASLNELLKESAGFLDVDSDNQTTTNTTRTVESSYLEFHNKLSEILKCLPKQCQSLVVVIDNMDRLEPSIARDFWSSLTPFFEKAAKTWASQKIWLIVPYSYNQLCKIFELDGSTNQRTKGFIEKTFDYRFTVPPPILLKWKDYMRQKLEATFSESEDRQHFDAILRIYDLRAAAKISPRDMNQFVNFLVLTKASLNADDKIPLSVIALYYFHQTTFSGTSTGNISENSGIGLYEQEAIGDVDCIPIFASIYFGVPLEDVPQVLMLKDIQEALRLQSKLDLQVLARRKGFNDVLRSALTIEIPTNGKDIPVHNVINAARAIAVLDPEKIPEFAFPHVARAYLISTNFQQSLDHLSDFLQIATTSIAIETRVKIFDKTKLQLEKIRFEDFETATINERVQSWWRAAALIPSAHGSIKVPRNEDLMFYVAHSCVRAAANKESILCSVDLSNAGINTFSSKYSELATFSETVGIARIISRDAEDIFGLLDPSEEKRLLEQQNLPPAQLLASATIAFLSEHIFGYQPPTWSDLVRRGVVLKKISPLDDGELKSALLAMLLTSALLERIDSPQALGAYQSLVNDRNEHCEQAIAMAASYFSQNQLIEALLPVAKESEILRPAALWILDLILDQQHRIKLTASDFTGSPNFLSVLNRSIHPDKQTGISRLFAQCNNLSAFIEEVIADGFESDDVLLYTKQLETSIGGKSPSLNRFLMSGLNTVPTATWVSDAKHDCDKYVTLINLAMRVSAANSTFSLGVGARDAFIDIQRQILSSDSPIPASKVAVSALKSLLDEDNRQLAEREFIKNVLAVSEGQKFQRINEVFDLSSFSSALLESFATDFCSKLDSLIRDRDEAGVDWMTEVIANNKKVFTSGERSIKKSVRGRLQTVLEEATTEDGAHEDLAVYKALHDLIKTSKAVKDLSE